jgi:hypothetical protein
VNAQELFLDVVNNRFLDGESTIAANKPAFYSDEQRRIRLAVRKVKNNKLSAVTPSTNSRYKMRLGNATQKLADATDIPTAPVVLITAIGSVVTASASQATGLGIVATYSPVTATFEATVSTETAVTAQFVANFRTTPAVTALFKADIVYVPPVTASVTVAILTTVTQFIVTTATVLTSTTFSYISTSTFSILTEDSPSVFSYLNTKYINQSYPYNSLNPLYLTAQMNTPIASVFSCSFSAGSVSTISLVGEGSGYPNGIYRLTFSGGGATAGTVTATAEVTTTAGKVTSISLINGGSGYASAPTATLFTPAKSLISISPTNSIGTVGGKARFSWALGRTPGDSASIRFTNPDTTSIVTNTSVPSAFLRFVEGSTWEINIIDNGYGYVSTPSVTHDDALVSTAKIKINKDGAGFSTTISTAGIAYISYGGLPIIPAQFITYAGKGIYEFANVGYTIDVGKTSVTTISYSRSNYSDSTGTSLFNFNELDYAGKTFYGSVTGSVIQNALIKASVPALTSGYNVVSNQGELQQGGGLFETEFEVIDYGKSYVESGIYYFNKIKPLFPLRSGQTIFQSPISSVVTIATVATNGFVGTLLSQRPTVATRTGNKSTEYFIANGGFGFVGSAIGTAFSEYQSSVVTQTITTGGLIVSTSAGIVTTASFIAYPKSYIIGTYDCQVQSPVSGTTAKIQLVISSATANVVIIDGGSGYTSAPIVTAPSPNGTNGYVSLLSSLNNPSGYTAGVSVGLLFSPSTATGGTAEGEFALKTSRYIYASAIASVAEKSIVVYEGVSTDPFQQAGVRSKYDPPIPSNAKIVGRTGSKIVAQNSSGSQSISEQQVTYLDYRITNSGFGYTIAPTVLAEAPSKSTGGQILSFNLVNKPAGYNFGTNYECSVATSPVSNGTAQLSFVLLETERTTFVRNGETVLILQNPELENLTFENLQFYDSKEISNTFSITNRKDYIIVSKQRYISSTYNAGFGYVTAPTVTASTPDATNVGQIIGLKLTNTPIGYRPNNEYQLTIGQSPIADGTATAKFSVSSLGVISAEVQNGGFGYITKPTITAPSPDLDQGYLAGVSVSTLGRGFAPGSYICNITDAPSGGETASVNFDVDNTGIGSFKIQRVGRGYISSPSISVPTPAGNIIKSISISCKGSYYEPQTAVFSINDSQGSGVSIGLPILSSGQIELLPIILSGYGYSNTPTIQFSAPTAPIPTQLESSFIEGDFNITTASANAILSTSTQKDILMEVYETDGTNEQVVAQATVSLAKRVLE